MGRGSTKHASPFTALWSLPSDHGSHGSHGGLPIRPPSGDFLVNFETRA
jgi:hypothetical protein